MGNPLGWEIVLVDNVIIILGKTTSKRDNRS
jgi:hypothetical protein